MEPELELPKPLHLPKAYKLNARDLEGSGETIVFLHGLGGTIRYWTSKLPDDRLAGRIVLIDLLGFGDSPRPWFRYTIDRHLTALHEVLQQYENITLVGHSMGATLAVIYAARYPEKVKALVLISLPNFQSQNRAFQWFRRRPRGWMLTNMFVVGLACIITRRIVGRLLPFVLTEYPKEVAEDLVKHNVLSSTTSLWNVIYGHDLRKDAVRISSDVPVLCIHSIDDDTAPFVDVEVLTQELPNWRLHALEEGRHHPWLWNAEACLVAIERFMNGSLDSFDT